ncbi:MAG: SLC45 family MFS transporter [Promethearchaeota archaeon]
MAETENSPNASATDFGPYVSPDSLEKLKVGRTFLIGLAFFASSVFWATYNPYVQNDILDNIYGLNTIAIGVFMVIDNVFGVVMQPWIGNLSDKTRTRFGTRIPYVMVFVPIAAVLFAVAPHVAYLPNSFWWFFGVIVAFNIAMAAFRAPAVALMPDLTPPKFRSTANGIINLMGGLATLIIFTLGAVLSAIRLEYTFYLSSVCALAAMALLYWRVKEPREPIPWHLIPGSGQTEDDLVDAGEKKSTWANLKDAFSSPNKSAAFVFFAIFFWFFAYNLVESFGAIFFEDTMGISTGQTTLLLSAFLIAFVLFSIPAGKISERIGRRNTILAGIALDFVVFVILAVVVHQVTTLVPIFVFFAIGGCGWGMINVNSIAIVWSLTTADKIGAYTGLYYFFSFMAQIVGPVIGGVVFYFVDIRYAMFPLSLVFFALSGFCMTRVKAGEVHEEGDEDRERREAFARSHVADD